MSIIFGECDCCGAINRVLHHGESYGLEAYACSECRLADPCDDVWEIEEEIEAIEADRQRRGIGGHRALLLSNLKDELVRLASERSADANAYCKGRTNR